MCEQVYSFDIFDTCLVRNVARPKDLFYKLYSQLSLYSRKDNCHEISSELAYYRMYSEAIGRSNHRDREDILIHEFYKYSYQAHKWNIKSNSILESELELEFQSIKPIIITKNRIEQLREKKNRIIFISDMYLPTRVIQKKLLFYNFAQQDDSIYVSGDIGLTKRTGSLFKYVLNKEGINPNQLHHYGDNIHSDVIVPRKLGIKAAHFKDSQLNQYEKRVITLSHAPVEVRSQIAGVSRAVRLMCADETKISQELASLATNVIAPLLVSYVVWVIEDAKKNNIEKLFFVSRDGQILYKIAKEFSEYINVPECHYLYGSRQAWFLPSVSSISRDSLDWLIIPGHSNAPRHLLKKLGIEPEEIKSVLEKYHFNDCSLDRQLDSERMERFWQVIETPEISSLILEKAQSAREITLKYFAQEGLCSTSKWAIVDIGWTLKCQRSLKQILNHLDNNNQVKGYYLGVFNHRLTTAEAGDYRAFLIQDAFPSTYPSSTEYIFRHQRIIEQVFTIADHSTVIGYQEKEDRIIPMLRSPKINSEQQRFVTSLHYLILEYANEISKTGILNNGLEELKRCAVNNAIEFLANPSKKEVCAIAWLKTGDDQNESKLRPVARKIGTKDLVYFAARLARRNFYRDYAEGFDWLEGSVAISNPLIRLIYFIFNALQNYVYEHKPIWIYQLWFQITKKI